MGRANSVDLRARVIRVAIRCFELGASIWCDSASGLRHRCQRGLELERRLRNPMAVPELWDCLLCQQTEEMRGATTLPTYRTAGGEQHKALAVAHLKNALSRWGEVVRVTKPRYRDMLLMTFIGNSKAMNPDASFPWRSVRPQVAADVKIAQDARRSASGGPNRSKEKKPSVTNLFG